MPIHLFSSTLFEIKRLKALSVVFIQLAFVLLCSSGCTSSSALVPYPSRIHSVQALMDDGSHARAYEKVKLTKDSSDKLLFAQEGGRIASLEPDYNKSISNYIQAARMVEVLRDRATISLTEASNNAAASIVNDNMIPYGGFSYETVFIHTFQALNYLAIGNLEGALIEVRKAQNEQKFAQSQEAFELAKVKEQSKKHKINWKEQEKALQDVFKEMDVAQGEAKSEFLNAYTFYISGLIYEVSGKYDDARVAYKHALELHPSNSYLRQAYKRAKARKSSIRPGTGRVILLYEEGFVPERKQIKVPLAWNGRIYTLALPYYKGKSEIGSPVVVIEDGDALGKTELACITRPLAVKALRKKYKGIVIRQLARLIVRDQSQKLVQDKDNSGAPTFALALLGLVFDNADLRSWLTLPRSMQILELDLAEGEHRLELSTVGQASTEHLVEVNDGETVIARVVRSTQGLRLLKLWPAAKGD